MALASALALTRTLSSPSLTPTFHPPPLTPASCEVDICIDCPAGTASAVPHLTSVDDCIFCAEGFFTHTNGSHSCNGPCGEGLYVTDNPTDSDGFGVTVGGRFCVACPAGRVTSKAGSTSCDACPMGSSSESGDSECTACPVGFFTDTAAAVTCRACPGGSYSDQSGQVTCSPCAAGTVSVSST